MEPIDASLGRALDWSHLSANPRAFALTSTAGLHGSLRWEPGRGSLAAGQTAGGWWTFKRVGFLRPRITVRALNSGADLAVYQPGLSGGVLHHGDGRRFAFARQGLWTPHWAFRLHDGPSVVRFQTAGSGSTLGATVALDEVGGCRDLVPRLVTAGWYLIVLARDDEELAVLTTVITAASS